MSLEYTTLEKCASQLETAFTSDINQITSYLFGENFFSDEIYKEVLDPKSVCSSVDKASRLVLEVLRAVKLEPSSYINYLRHDKRKYSDIVGVLDAEYFVNSKLPMFVLPYGQLGM